MPNFKKYVFVFWGTMFDEAAATAFVTELRSVGLLVKVVGLLPKQTGGACGLTLVADLTLDQALKLAKKTICLIIPAEISSNNPLLHDPRLLRLFEQAVLNGAKFIIRQDNETILTDMGLAPPVMEIMTYPEAETVVRFAREVANMLLREIS